MAGPALGIPWATVAVTPLSLTSADLPPVGAPWTPATGPAGWLRDAGLRMLSVVHMTQGTLDVDLNELLKPAIAAPAAPGCRPIGPDRCDVSAGGEPLAGPDAPAEHDGPPRGTTPAG